VFIRRRFENGWTEKKIEPGSIGIVGANHSAECELVDEAEISHIFLSNELMASTAALACEQDYKRLEVPGGIGVMDPEVRVLGEMLAGELHSPGGGSSLLVDSIASALSVHLIRDYYRNVKIRNPVSSDWRLTAIQRAHMLDFIEANIACDFGLQQMATAVGMSATHLCRCFKNTFGDSPHQFVLKQRVRLAIEKIRGTNLPFSEIALIAGFCDQAHLTRTIKNATGQTPRSLRKV
jgi:AraC family transcriptional regulator